MNDYPILAPPFTLAFEKMSKKELDAYFEWYLDQIPQRVAFLERAVRSTSGHEGWKADFFPESLNELGEWFAGQVEQRRRTDEEIKEKTEGLPWPTNQIEISKWELTNRTFSLAIDIGMYVSQVFLKNVPVLKWDHKTRGSKNWIDYGQPILVGFFDKDVFNPAQMMVTLAYGLVKNTKNGNRLRELYEIWKKKALNT